MNSPITGRQMELVRENRVLEFRKESFEIIYHFYRCKETGEEFEDDQLGDLNLDQVYNAYRARHKFPFPEEIKELRGRYDLPATAMSQILGFGVNQYRLYETGEIPSETNARLIQMASNSDEFLRLIELSDVSELRQKDKLLKRIEELKRRQSAANLFTERTLGVSTPSEFNGYRKTDPEKAYHMIRFLAEDLRPLKTALNKLLFYADFYHFKKFGMGISGLQYRAIQWGPVPSQFDYLFKMAEEHNVINLRYEVWDGDINDVREMVIIDPSGETEFRSELFAGTEIESLQVIMDKFKKTRTGQLVDISHNEPAWKNNIEEKKLISYKYAFELLAL
ncbi:MAG TPA: type II toxin-antitoxin system antitoxin SocA domain-containing protein [Puia sp.]|nr:type II toxin-antitoxin system antitoxin SocA domain-containing protein [Puia sp.]